MLDAAIWKELGAEEVSKSEAFYDALGTLLSRWLLARSEYPEMEAIKLLQRSGHYPSFMAGIYSSAHTRTFCYSPQIRARSIRCAPEFSS